MNIILHSGGEFPVLNITQIGYSNDIKVTHHGPARRNVYIIHYILRGKGYFNEHKVESGEGFLIRPGDFEEYHADSSDPWEFLWVVSNDAGMEKIFLSYCADENGIFKFDFVPKLYETVHRMGRMRGGVLSKCEMLAIYLDILLHHESRGVHHRVSAEKIYCDAAVNYVRENLAGNLTVEGIAVFLGVSRAYLYKMFVFEFGKSPKQYINDMRLSIAKNLIKETNVCISEVARSVGYPDVLSFSKFFSSKVGMSPTAFRVKNNIKEEGF